jgi:purine-binding chemotaxis protein CheW
MGRMADARKRAKQKGESSEKAGGEPLAAATVPESESAAPTPSELVFDDAPAAAVRIELPASGLAEDILARHEAALQTAEPASAGEPALPSFVAPEAAPAAGHSLSFFAAPVQDHRAAAEATEHLVTFYLDREEYGVDVRQVQEIRRVGEITTVPRAPEFVRGVINLRGRILPVLDLKKKLGLGEVEESRAARIVVVRVRERLLGLLVDGASQVPKIPVSRIEPPPAEVVERGGDYIRGVAKLDDRLIILVDLVRLLAYELRSGSGGPAAPARPETGPVGVS